MGLFDLKFRSKSSWFLCVAVVIDAAASNIALYWSSSDLQADKVGVMVSKYSQKCSLEILDIYSLQTTLIEYLCVVVGTQLRGIRDSSAISL